MELGIKQLKKLIGTTVIVDCIGEHWIESCKGKRQGIVILEDGCLKIKTNKDSLKLCWKSDIPTLSFKIYRQ